jgi:hypothetical protein
MTGMWCSCSFGDTCAFPVAQTPLFATVLKMSRRPFHGARWSNGLAATNIVFLPLFSLLALNFALALSKIKGVLQFVFVSISVLFL